MTMLPARAAIENVSARYRPPNGSGESIAVTNNANTDTEDSGEENKNKLGLTDAIPQHMREIRFKSVNWLG
jgi:hypothetical protein